MVAQNAQMTKERGKVKKPVIMPPDIIKRIGRNRRMIFMFATVFLSFILASIVSVYSLAGLARENTKEIDTMLTYRIYDSISNRLNEPVMVSKTMACDEFLAGFLEDEDEMDEDEAIRMMQNYLQGIRDRLEYDTAFLVSEKSRRYYTYEGLNKIVDPVNDDHDIWYSIFVENGRDYDLDVDTDEMNRDHWTVFVNARIEDRSGNLLGVCGVGVQMSNLQELFKAAEESYNVKVNLVDAKGLVQIDTEDINIENVWLDEEVLSSEKSGDYTYRTRDDGEFVITKYVEPLGWYLVVSSAPAGISGEVRNVIMINVILLLFVMTVLVIMISIALLADRRVHRSELEASIDKLTGFLNKYNANEQISKLCETCDGTLMIIDIDSFKLVNDIYGHDTGDMILEKFARIIRNSMPYDAVYGRIGGDEFLLFAVNMKDEEDIGRFSDTVNNRLVEAAKSLMGNDMSIPIGASIGAVSVPEQGRNFNELFRNCDRVLYMVKNNGKHGYSVYKGDEEDDTIPADITLAMLTTILEERNIPRNAMWMGKEAFGNIYRYMIRYMDRYRGTAYKMLFTAKFIPRDLSDTEKQKIMVSLRELLQESLRSSDIMMQLGYNHFFLLLPEISDYNIKRVIDRVMRSWRHNKYSGLVELDVETESTDVEMPDNTVDEENGRRIIVADDDESERLHILEALSDEGYKVSTVASGDELESAINESGCDLMIVKASMGDNGGIRSVENIRRMGGAFRRIPIIFIPDTDEDTSRRCLELGTGDFLRMPASADEIRLKADNILRLYALRNYMSQEVEKKSEENEQLGIHIIKALVYVIDAKDRYTNGHSSRVAEYAKEIAGRYGYSEKEQNDIYIAGLLHDVGKIGVPDAIINKNDSLTDEEYDIIKRHPMIGYNILATIKEMPNLSDGARWHHERYDGRGYPDGLKGEDIPEVARIIAVADAYDAMTSRRSYRDTMPQSKVRAEIERCSGTQFDPKFAALMLEIIDEDTEYSLREIIVSEAIPGYSP